MELDSNCIIEAAVLSHVEILIPVWLIPHSRVTLAVYEQADAAGVKVLEPERVLGDVASVSR